MNQAEREVLGDFENDKISEVQKSLLDLDHLDQDDGGEAHSGVINRLRDFGPDRAVQWEIRITADNVDSSTEENAKKCMEFRAISLISHSAKILLRILNQRLYSKMEVQLEEEQLGFRRAASAAELDVKNKVNKYAHLLDNYIFVPFAVETFGPWSHDAEVLVSQIGQILISITGDPRCTTYLRQRLSVAIQRGNAMSVLGTLLESSPLDEFFLL
ncbi:hypothetical protein ANN_10490 [Periplaneta americana]|uniref:Uncharacterized protein n=1 Tax=Periplaneta americana TaxID=6978 RepID=A0ABQ8TSB3_PERAM|nr:hypothetical protein ANN_10490 [Periplaneta americana]